MTDTMTSTSTPDPVAGRSVLPSRRTTAVVLVLAPLLEIVEALISPLDGRSTLRDVQAVSLHQGRFAISVLIGTIGTVLFLPALVGLASACAPRLPRLARAGAVLSVASIAGFLAVRGTQLCELGAAQAGVAPHDVAGMLDHLTGSVLGVVVLVAFLGGALSGTLVLAVATWRAGFPKPAAVLLASFQFVDLALPDHPEKLTALSHLVLLVALGWCAAVLWRGGPATSPR